MRDKKRYLRVASVLVIAGGTGHVMQYGGATLAWFGLSEAASAATGPADRGPATSSPVLSSPNDGDERGLSFIPGAAEVHPPVAAPARLPDPEHKRVAALETATDASVSAPAPHVDACAASIGAAAAPAAMVALEISAPCHPGTRVRIRHSVLDFVGRTDEQGVLKIEIPALDVLASIEASLEGLEPLATVVEIPALNEFERVAVAWAGAAGIELHAFEFGASYNTDGHVWHGAPRDASWAARGEGGFAVRFGNPEDPVPAMADVYTFPAAASTRQGVVRLTLETQVSGSNCRQDIAGHAVQVSDGAATSPVEVVLAMPDCDATGDYLVLNNLFRDLKIAAR